LRFEHRKAYFTTALRAWYSSPYASNFTSFVFSLAHYQRVSLKRPQSLADCGLENIFIPFVFKG